MQTPLHFLASFLAYTAQTEELKAVFTALVKELAGSENRERLAGRALQVPLGEVVSFLEYAAKTPRLKPVQEAIVDQLAQEENRKRIAQRVVQIPLDQLVGILGTEAAAHLCDVVLAYIDTASWDKARARERSPNVHAYASFQRIAARKSHFDLSQAPALNLILRSTTEQWRLPGIGLHHLSHVIRCAQGASAADLQGFLERVTTPDWVDGLLASAPTGGLAGNLLALATVLEPSQWGWFQRDALRGRISREIPPRETPDAESWAQALALLGACAALGVFVSPGNVNWPGTAGLAAILAAREPDLDRTTIGPLQVQLWLGLREMARLRTDTATVPPERGNGILALWQATQEDEAGNTLRPHVRTLNAEVIEWLRQCQAADWRLVRPRTESRMGESG